MIFTFNLSLNANNCIRLNNLHLLQLFLLSYKEIMQRCIIENGIVGISKHFI